MAQTTVIETKSALAYYDDERNVHVIPRAKDDVRKAVLAFIDMAATSTGQETFYNSKEEQ